MPTNGVNSGSLKTQTLLTTTEILLSISGRLKNRKEKGMKPLQFNSLGRLKTKGPYYASELLKFHLIGNELQDLE